MKRLLAIVLPVLAALSAVAASTDTTGMWEFKSNGSLATITLWKGTGTTLEVPETISAIVDGNEVSSSELDIFSDLLAAAYSNDPEYALEKIEEIKYYLHRQQIETVDYSEDTVRFFDLMPGQYAGTIRPALVADGNLLRKGIASAGSK